jgi:hypothetical protein
MDSLSVLLRRLRDQSLPRRYPHVCEALQQFTAGSRICLEIGCGGKQYGDYIEGHHIGLDLQRGHYPGDGADILGSAIFMPVRSESVDIVVMVATLLFMDEWEGPVEQSARILNRGGRLVIFDYKPRTAIRLGYPGRFTPQSLRDKMESCGLSTQMHTEFLPIHTIGPLRSHWVRRLASHVLNRAGSWIVATGNKP